MESMGADLLTPLLPDEASGAPLPEQAACLVSEGYRLTPVAGGIEAALRPLLRCMNRPLERWHFTARAGLPPRTACRVLASLLAFAVLREESPRSPVHFGLPLASLRFLFPRLWPEAEPPEA
jgi:hypothetical protein